MLEKLSNYNIILASGSPRRQDFLKELNIPFTVKTYAVEEVYDPNLQREEITNYLAELKAKPFETNLASNDLVITSDTIVWHKDKALGKPKNKEEAFAMLRELSDDFHEVITSISFKTSKKTETLWEVTKVFFKRLTNEEINYYIENFKPYDKAGSYGIQEWIGTIAVEKIEGNYTNVIGMPMTKLYDFLSNNLP